jgi:hypothetical protein
MMVRVDIGSNLRKYVYGYQPDQGLVIHVEKVLTLGEFIEYIGIPLEEVQVTTVNRCVAPLDKELGGGDVIGIFSAALGG